MPLTQPETLLTMLLATLLAAVDSVVVLKLRN
jgi:hypothetical protein